MLSIVTDDGAARAVWLDPETGAAAGLRPGAQAVEASTVSPDWIAELAGAVPGLVDAPVVGSRPQAEAGALVFLAGGEEAAIDALRPVLRTMGAAVHRLGAVGAGTRAKLVVNGLFTIQVAAVGELLGFARAAGLDEARTVDVLGELAVTSPAAKAVSGAVLARKWAPLFPLELAAKDLRLLTAAAAQAGVEAPTGAAVSAVFERARERGLGGQNLHAVAQLFGA